MIVEGLLDKMHVRSHLMKLIIGSTITALMISLGMIGILKLLSFSVNPGITAVIAVSGAAAYAAKCKYEKSNS